MTGRTAGAGSGSDGGSWTDGRVPTYRTAQDTTTATTAASPAHTVTSTTAATSSSNSSSRTAHHRPRAPFGGIEEVQSGQPGALPVLRPVADHQPHVGRVVLAVALGKVQSGFDE